MSALIAPLESLLAPAPALADLQLYDAGPCAVDRWSLVHPCVEIEGVAYTHVTSFSHDPAHPQGVWVSEMLRAEDFEPDHLGQRVTFEQLPVAVQAAVRKEILE